MAISEPSETDALSTLLSTSVQPTATPDPELELKTTPATTPSAPESETDASSTLLTTGVQPTPTPDPELGLKRTPPATPGKRRRHRFRRFKVVMGGLASFFMKLFSLLWIGLFYGIPGIILVALGIVVFIGIPFAFTSAYGAIAMLIGNGILRAGHLAHYTNNASAAAIGATGAIVASLALGLSMQCLCLKYDDEHPAPWYIRMGGTVVVHTLSGAIGSAILLHHHVDLGGIDILHATRAGALGGAILGPGSILALPIIAAGLGIIFSPLWIAMMMGLRWVHVRSSESYEDATYRSSYCVTYGTCGDDPEIEEELDRLPNRGRLMFD